LNRKIFLSATSAPAKNPSPSLTTRRFTLPDPAYIKALETQNKTQNKTENLIKETAILVPFHTKKEKREKQRRPHTHFQNFANHE